MRFLHLLGGRGLHQRRAIGQDRAAEGPAREGDDGVSLAAAGEDGAEEEEVEEGQEGEEEGEGEGCGEGDGGRRREGVGGGWLGGGG